MINEQRIEEAASEFATHKKDCTCKGKHFNEDKAKGFTAGAYFAAQEYEKEIEALRSIKSSMSDVIDIKSQDIKELKQRLEAVENDDTEFFNQKIAESLLEYKANLEIAVEALERLDKITVLAESARYLIKEVLAKISAESDTK